MDTTRRAVVELLRDTRALLARPENDFAWSSWPDADAALWELDRLIAAVETGSVPGRADLDVLFAPTGPIQEVGLSGGWADTFLALAREFDAAAARLYAPRGNAPARPYLRPWSVEFLTGTAETPGDDASRLGHADWIAEHGDGPRADFIRTQCELARGGLDDGRRQELERRQNELLCLHGRDWAGRPLADLLPAPRPGERGVWSDLFHRGFLETVVLDYDQFIEHAEALLRSHPIRRAVVRLRLADQQPLEVLTALPALARLAELEVVSGGSYFVRDDDSEFGGGHRPVVIDRAGVRALASCRHLSNLRSLRLPGHRFGEDGAAVLAASPHLAGLTRLDLTGNHIGDAGARAVAASPALAGLRVLVLGDNALHAAGATAVAASPHLGRLTELDLRSNVVGDEGAGGLAASAALPHLSVLILEHNLLSDVGCRALAAASALTGLTRLSLRRNGIGDAGVTALATSPHMTSLTHLDLAFNQIGAAGARAIAQSACLGQLQFLDLYDNAIRLDGASALVASTRLGRLAELNIARNGIELKWGALLNERFGRRRLVVGL